MNKLAAATLLAVTGITGAGCSGSSSGPGGVLNVATQAGVVAGCANVRTAATDEQAGDDTSAAAALHAAVTALRKPPVDAGGATAATSIETKLAANDTGGALSTGSTFCAGRGQ
jgi:hypothetical protein